MDMIRKYILYGSLGICMEVLWTGLGSLLKGDALLLSKTNIWMFLIYGLAVFLEPIHMKIKKWPLVLRGGVYALLIFITEYLTGYFLNWLLGVCPWFYEDPLSIHGFITLSFAPVWFVVGLIFERFHYVLSTIPTKT